MARKRKTTEVADLLFIANLRLSLPDETVRDLPVTGMDAPLDPKTYRFAVASFLEHVLFTTGNYKGFGYQPSEVTPEGRLRDGHDDTRRRYF